MRARANAREQPVVDEEQCREHVARVVFEAFGVLEALHLQQRHSALRVPRHNRRWRAPLHAHARLQRASHEPRPISEGDEQHLSTKTKF